MSGYALRKNGYGARRAGYGATTNCPPCCGDGGMFVRAKDCCSNVFAWFSVESMSCSTDVGTVFNAMLRCWTVVGPILTRPEIEDGYPSEEIIDSFASACVSGCDAKPDCPDCVPCCWIIYNPACPPTGDCSCVRGPCTGGRRWRVDWGIADSAEQWNPNGTMENKYVRTGSGSLTWQFSEDETGHCLLQLLSATGSVRVIIDECLTCTVPFHSDNTYAINKDDPGQHALFAITGVGQNIGALVQFLFEFTGNFGCAAALQCLSNPACPPYNGTDCEYLCDRTCDDVNGGCGKHHRILQGTTCYGASWLEEYESHYDYTGCPLQSKCNENYNQSVTILEPCLVGGGGDTGGTLADLPARGTGAFL